MAWDPPNLPLFSPSPSTNNFPSLRPPSGPAIPLGSRPPTLGADNSPWPSTQSLPSFAIPEGGLLGALATLGMRSTTPALPEGGLLGALATLGGPSSSTPTSSLAAGLFPAVGRPAWPPMPGNDPYPIPSAFSQPSLSPLMVSASGQAGTRPGWVPLGPGSGWEPWADQFIKGMQGLINYFRSRQSLGNPDAPGCKEEWDDARRKCAEWLAQKQYRGLAGGYRNVEDCARGHVSERCGGNPVTR